MKPNNPPAFPTHDITSTMTENGYRTTPISHGGMTLRDYFAAAALQALLSIECYDDCTTDYAEAAYAQADAMLAERAKGGAQ